MAQAISVAAEQTGIGFCCHKSSRAEEERENVLLCLVASRLETDYENLAPVADILGCGNFNLAASAA